MSVILFDEERKMIIEKYIYEERGILISGTIKFKEIPVDKIMRYSFIDSGIVPNKFDDVYDLFAVLWKSKLSNNFKILKDGIYRELPKEHFQIIQEIHLSSCLKDTQWCFYYFPKIETISTEFVIAGDAVNDDFQVVALYTLR
jgi:hypothetical protein